MSITSGPSISGGSSASRLYSLADEGVLPLRVTVKSLKATLRPTVGLRVGLDTSMREILEKALAFNDRLQKPEHEILEILSRPVDIAVSNARTEGTDAAVRVQLDTPVREALMFEHMDRILFESIPSVRRKRLPMSTDCDQTVSWNVCSHVAWRSHSVLLSILTVS